MQGHASPAAAAARSAYCRRHSGRLDGPGWRRYSFPVAAPAVFQDWPVRECLVLASGHRWYRHPGRAAGFAVAALCAVYLAAVLHLALVGRVVPGESLRLGYGEAVEDGAPVPYTYTVNGSTYDGWRRGIGYGGERLSVVCSPILPSFHYTSVRPGLASARALWSEPDYWLRLVLALAGVALGLGMERAWYRFERGGGVFLPGLHRGETP